jgi:hypothetical protein
MSLMPAATIERIASFGGVRTSDGLPSFPNIAIGLFSGSYRPLGFWALSANPCTGKPSMCCT